MILLKSSFLTQIVLTKTIIHCKNKQIYSLLQEKLSGMLWNHMQTISVSYLHFCWPIMMFMFFVLTSSSVAGVVIWYLTPKLLRCASFNRFLFLTCHTCLSQQRVFFYMIPPSSTKLELVGVRHWNKFTLYLYSLSSYSRSLRYEITHIILFPYFRQLSLRVRVSFCLLPEGKININVVRKKIVQS